MRDPMTTAFEIRYPWRAYRNARNEWERTYRHSFITIWHMDPEKDGSDDSCGWFSPKLSKDQKARMDSIAGDEARSPWFMASRTKQIDSPTEAETLLRQAFMLVGKVMSRQHLCKPAIRPVTFEEASAWACLMTANSVDNFRSSLAFLPGWHSNSQEDQEWNRKDAAQRFFYAIARYILRERRPWYRHPRWHLKHWKIQIHPLLAFKRWAFSRCSKCGRGFAWGESPVTSSWNSTGPQWFRSEKNIWHGNCDSVRVAQPAEQVSVTK